MFTKRSLFLKKHSRRVLIIKHTLPLFAFMLASIIVAWPLLTPDKERFDLPIQKSDIKMPSLDMENVRFYAQGEKNRVVTVTAESAKEIDAPEQISRLEKPQSVYSLTDGDTLTSTTSYGLVYQKDKYFLFNQPIKTVSKSGYTAHNRHVKVTFDGIADSDHTIKISGPAGSLIADGFHLKDKGNFIHFKGKTDSKLEKKGDRQDLRHKSKIGLKKSKCINLEHSPESK